MFSQGPNRSTQKRIAPKALLSAKGGLRRSCDDFRQARLSLAVLLGCRDGVRPVAAAGKRIADAERIHRNLKL